MKRVVFLKSRLAFRGGLEKYTIRLAKAFVDKGCSVTILTTGAAPRIEGLEIISIAEDSKFSLSHLYRFDQLCRKWTHSHPSDLVFGMERTTEQTHYRAGSGVHAVFLKQRALIDSPLKRLSFHLNPLHRYLLYSEKKAFENPLLRLLFTNSEMVRNEILQNYSTSPLKLQTIHNGVEWKEWELDFKKSFEMPKKSEPYHFLFVGNGFRRKGLPFLLEGLKYLSEEVRVTVVGKDKNLDWYRHHYKNVQFKGSQDDIRPFYQQADALVIPSIYDPFANVTVEALAMGLYVVTSRFNGGKEVLTPQSGTVIEDLTSPQSVAHALQTALSFPKNLSHATQIRQSIKDLDFSNQLYKIVERCIL